MKICIIGNCGSGKSTLAKNISQKLSLPYLEFDRLWFDADGHKVSRTDTAGRDQVREKIRIRIETFLHEHDSWVIEGWQARFQESIAAVADHIIFIDIPLPRRIYNHLKRAFLSPRHAELSLWGDLKFTKEIIKRTYTHGKDMQTFATKHADKTFIFKTYKEVNRYLSKL
jgi:adenylate kinase family enzyme